MKEAASMRRTHPARRSGWPTAALFAVVAACTLAGCASTPSAPRQQRAAAPVRIDIQEQVGFTIVEEGRISEAVRADYDTALRYLQQGDLQQGIALLEAIVVEAPELAAPHIDLGIAQHRAGNLEAAQAALQRAVEVNPSHPIAHNELGIVYRKQARFDEAKQSYEAALRIYPGYHYARRNLAILCDLYLADPECALRNYEAYMTTVPADEEVSMWMADLRYRMDQGGR